MKATHIISAVHYPEIGEIELTWEDTITGKRAGATFSCDEATGHAIAETVSPCVYHDATVKEASHEQS